MNPERLESAELPDELGIELSDEELAAIHGADGIYPPDDGTGLPGGGPIDPPPDIPLQ